MAAQDRDPGQRLRRLSSYLRERFGERVYKVCLEAGFGCPNRDGTLGSAGCTFCADEALQPSGRAAGMSIAKQLAAGIDYVTRRHRAQRFIAYLQDHSATYAAPARLAAVYRAALDDPRVVGLAVGTRPDCVPPPVVELLAELRTTRVELLWLELGLQIADDRLLATTRRQHSVADFVDAARRCQRAGLAVCAHVIIGLPGATAELEAATAELLAELGVWGVKLHAFNVLRGSAMARVHAAGRLTLLELDDYVARVVRFLERLPPETVIHRVTGEAARRLTVAPSWTVNKMVVYDAVLAELGRRDTRQGAALVNPTRQR